MTLKNIPQAERLLSGTLTSYLSDVATTCVMSDPPSKFPTYIDLEPDSTTKKELIRAVAVSGSTVTIERSVNGVVTDHAANATYKQKITSRHWDAVSDALEKGYLMEDALRALIRVSDTQFTITGYGASDDLTTKYAVGRYLRSNSSNSYVTQVTSSSYAAGTNKTTVNVADTLPTPLSTIEMAIGAEGGFAHLKVKATSAEVATGTDDTKIVTPLAAAPYGYSSMARQALINGNFDVNQRYPGTSLVKTVGSDVLFMDRWKTWNAPDTGTLPTLTFTQTALTPGELPGSYYVHRVSSNGAGTSLGVNSYGLVSQAIENGTRFLCGNGKKLTLSFWARSNIAGKKLGLYFNQGYGTGGSPTATEIITTSAPVTLTSTLTKYTYTITTNTLTGKTFGTANNDTFEVVLCYQWGSTFGATRGLGSAETYGGSGYVDIAQVQLCEGDVALPFQPKSFNQELLDCMRYYEKSYPYATAPSNGTTSNIPGKGSAYSTTRIDGLIHFKVRKRVAPTNNTFYTANGGTAGTWEYYDNAGSWLANKVVAANNVSEDKMNVELQTTGVTAGNSYSFRGDWAVECEL